VAGTTAVLVSWSLLVVADASREGEFTAFAIIVMLAGFAVLVATLASRIPIQLPDSRALMLPMAVAVIAAAVHPVERNMHRSGLTILPIQILAGLTAVVAAGTLLLGDRWQRRAFLAVVAMALATGITTILIVVAPNIDVWFLLDQSSTGLLHGLDMYNQHWHHSRGLQAVYPYLPWTTLILAPFRWLLGDVRYGLVAGFVIAAFLVRRLAPNAPAALPALLLVFPHWAFMIAQAWTEPLLIAALAGSILAMQQRRPWLAVVCFAVALACKQHVVLLLPLFAIWPVFGWRRAAASAGLALGFVSPWLIADPSAFWHDAVSAELALPVIPRALSLPSLFSRWGFTVGFWFLLLVVVATYALVVRVVPRTPSGLAIGSAAVMWAVDLANKQSFFNHYMLPMGLLVIAIAAAPRTAQPAEAPS
jgi:hypothetical protein